MTSHAGAPLALYPYQLRILDEAQQRLRQEPSLLVTAPTGAGKTVILAEILARARARQRRAGLLVHRQELIKQSAAKIAAQDPQGQEPGIVWQSQRDWSRPVTIIAQDTFNGQPLPAQAADLDLLIIDEAHHAIAPSWLDSIQRLNPKLLLGFSATPFRQDREPLCPQPFAAVIRPITPQELINLGILCPARIESPIVHDRFGQPQPVNQADNLEAIYAQAVHYAIAEQRTRILLYVSPNRSRTPTQVIQRSARALRRSGFTVESISQETNAKRREAALERFAQAPGASILINYMALTEGTDIPSVDCVVIGRRTLSESTIIQMIGRGLRCYPGKEDCLVLDYTGRPDMNDIIHYWRLDSDKENSDAAELLDPEAEELTKPERLSKAELTELAVQFPRQLSTLQQAQIEYPWFKPYPHQPIMALPLWNASGQNQDQYIAIEPKPKGQWQVTLVTVHSTGPAPLTRRQQTVPNAEAAAGLVRQALGGNAHRINRAAAWRLQPATEKQQKAWRRLHPEARTDPARLTAGEISDTISCRRFQNRVALKALRGSSR